MDVVFFWLFLVRCEEHGVLPAEVKDLEDRDGVMYMVEFIGSVHG